MKRILLLLALLPLSCVLPSDRGQQRAGDVEAVARLKVERAEQMRESAKLREELAKVREELAVKERAEQERRRIERERERAEKERKLVEGLKAELRRGLAVALREEGEELRKEMDRRIQGLLRQVQKDREGDRQAFAKLLMERLGPLEKAAKTAPEPGKEPWKKELEALGALLSKERSSAAKDRASMRRDLEALMKVIKSALAAAKKERQRLATKIPPPAPKIDIEAIVDRVVNKLRPEIKAGAQRALKASLDTSLEASLENHLKKKMVPALKPLNDRLLRVDAMGEKRAKDLDLKVTALGRAVDSLVRAVRALRAQAKARPAMVPSSKTSKPKAPKPKTSESRTPKRKTPASKPPKEGGAGKNTPLPIRRRKAGIPVFGEGDGFFERPEYWIPSLVGLLLIFILLGRRPRSGDGAPHLVGGRYLPRPSEGSRPRAKRLAAEPKVTEVPSSIPQPQTATSGTPSPMHLSLRIPLEELAPGGEEAVRAFLASETMVLVRPEPRVDRRTDGSLSIRFYIPGSLPPHLRRELRERCESLAVNHVSSPSN